MQQVYLEIGLWQDGVMSPLKCKLMLMARPLVHHNTGGSVGAVTRWCKWLTQQRPRCFEGFITISFNVSRPTLSCTAAPASRHVRAHHEFLFKPASLETSPMG